MKKGMKRAVALLIVVWMLIFGISACQTEPGAETEGSTLGEATEGTTEATIEETTAETEAPLPDWYLSKPSCDAQLSHLPDEIGTEKDEIMVLYWSDCEIGEFESQFGVSYEQELYKRNMAVTEKLGVKRLGFVCIPGNHGQKEEFAEFVGKSYLSGEQKYDVIATYSRTAALCAIQGYYADLSAVEESYLDLSKPWWPASLEQDLMVDGALYYVTGDISTAFTSMMYSVVLNLDFAEELRIEDPVAMVKDGSWTVAELIRLSEGLYRDLDGDGERSAGDRYGFSTQQLHTDAFYHGSGLRLVEPDAEKGLVISPDYTSETLGKLAFLLGNFIASEDTDGRYGERTYHDGEVLFAMNRIYVAERKMRSSKMQYIHLPVPKYLETQDGYSTCVANPFSLWGIMADALPEQKVLCTALLECMGRCGYTSMTPIIFGENVCPHLDEETERDAARLFELIREGAVLDYGRILPNDVMPAYMNEVFSKIVHGKADPETGWRTEEMASALAEAAMRLCKGAE